MNRTYLFLGAITSLAVVYGSILPLDYSPKSIEEAFSKWQTIAWVNLGLYHRSDWIANALVFIPTAFFWMGAIGYRTRSVVFKSFGALLVVAVLLGLVFGIEFLQIWFPNRTLSQNDIFAGCCGVLAGVIFWFIAGSWLTDRYIGFFALTSVHQRLLAVAYAGCAISILYSLFPFDFVLTSGEYQKKWALGRISLDLLPEHVFSLEFLKPALVSILRGVPFGLFIFLRSENNLGRSLFVLGCISVLIELIQLPIYSKYTRWYDVPFTFFGSVVTFEFLRQRSLWTRLMGLWQLWAIVVLVWIIGIVFILLDLKSIVLRQRPLVDRLSVDWWEVLKPPFASHYFTSEYSALTNLAEKGLFFCILGGLMAMLEWAWLQRPDRLWGLFGLILFLSLGTFIEVAQLYQSYQFADSTDIIAYFLGGSAGLWLTRRILYGTVA